MKKYVFLFLLLVFVPAIAPAYYVWHPCCRSNGWWGGAEYLMAWRKERFYPALATTSAVGVPTLSNPSTSILFGDEHIGGKARSGVKADLGAWCSKCMALGAGMFAVIEEKNTFSTNGGPTGLPILGRPVLDVTTGTQEAYLVSFPILAQNGSIEIDTTNHLWGADFYVRYRFDGNCTFHIDLLGGAMYNEVSDNLNITTHTTLPVGPTVEDVNDQFNCRNDFWGGMVGVVTELRGKDFGILVTGKLGLGGMKRRATIIGSTTDSTIGGPIIISPVGLLAQPTNIGDHKHWKFEWIPQVSANFQYRLWRHFWFTAGYTYMFWPAIFLSGEQVDLAVNFTQFPGPTVGVPAPLPPNKDKSFWMQGFTAGFYFLF